MGATVIDTARRSALTAALVLLVAASAAHAASPAGLELFEKKVRPVLVEHCYKCHSVGPKKPKGGLALDSRDGLLKGGESGPALVPGRPDESRLIRAVRYTDDALLMPPKGKLPASVIADLEEWARIGAPDPRTGPAAVTSSSWQEVLRSRGKWWSLQPVRRPAVPLPSTAWSDDPVDHFVLARLDAAGLAPATPADRRTLLRRASLVLTGLLPSARDVEEFVADPSPAAYERVVDRLLASPHFGERWARHWMDVVRFTETHGSEWNYEVHHAWRYRDYLIRAFNADVPFDQLIREHIAGDLLSRPRYNDRERFNEPVIGTAFWRFGEANHDDCIEFRGIGFDIADNQIDTLGKAFLGMTIACARCHDHKLDAVSMKDYYGLLGMLRSSRPVSHTIDAPEVNAALQEKLRAIKDDLRRELGALWQREAAEMGRYLLAAQARRDKRPDAATRAQGLETARLQDWVVALGDAKPGPDSFLHPWLAIRSRAANEVATTWQRTGTDYEQELHRRAQANAQGFVSFGDFRAGVPSGWQATGQGLRGGPTRAGEFTVALEGDGAVGALLPAGLYTHGLSEKLNGALRSPVIASGHKHLSLRVLGGRTAAARLVSNNCQLNYKNYRVLKSAEPTWLTFSVPEDAAALRAYVELMTKFDSPKYPDQLGTLSGDDTNQRVPWEQAATDPRSFFGISRAVLHDGPTAPVDEPTYLRPLFAGPAARSLEDAAARYTAVSAATVRAWIEGRASDDDVRWLDGLLRRGLLSNARKAMPRLDTLIAKYRDLEKRLQLPRIVPGLADTGDAYDQPVLVRGDARKPSEPAPRRFVEVLTKSGVPFGSHGSGRLRLAECIASSDNPLTARVFVNRAWHHVFGAGLVRTTDDFGHVGDLPSHPELLDHLASRFVDEGWSLKRLLRSLVLTQTFRMGNRAGARGKEIDPQNRLLSHYPARRMEAEAVRDAILTVSGRLDPALYGPSVPTYREKANEDRRLFPGPLDGRGRRSIYLKVSLMEVPHFLGAFNVPGGKVAQGRRDVTNVPAQALALLNDPFVLQQAAVWAERLVSSVDADAGHRIERMFRAALGRPPTADERARFVAAATELAVLHDVAADTLLSSRVVWQDLAHVLFNFEELLSIP